MKLLYIGWMLLGLMTLALTGCEEPADPGENPEDTPKQNDDNEENDDDEDEAPTAPPIELEIEDTVLQMRHEDASTWTSLLDLTYLSGDGTPGSFKHEDGMVYWRSSDDSEYAPLVSEAALVGLYTDALDLQDARLRMDGEHFEYYDASSESWRLLFNVGMVDEQFVFSTHPEDGNGASDEPSIKYKNLGSRIPLLESFGHYEGHKAYEGVPVPKDTYDEEEALHYPTGYDAEFIVPDTLINREGVCQNPDFQQCYGGKVELQFLSDTSDILMTPSAIRWDEVDQLTLTVDALSQGVAIDAGFEGDNDAFGTITEEGTHTFEVDTEAFARFMLNVEGSQDSKVQLSEVTMKDSDGDTHVRYDGLDMVDWSLMGSDVQKTHADAIGIVADFEYDTYAAIFGLNTLDIPNKAYEEALERFDSVCDDPDPHPDDPENPDMGVFNEACPIREVLGKKNSVTGPDGTEYYMVEVKALEYKLDGFDKKPFAFFGILYESTPRMADETIEEIIVSDAYDKVPFGAFYHASNLKRVTLPDTITEIERYAFYHTDSLEAINLPEGLHTIGPQAFSYATSLKTLSLPSTLETLDTFAFANASIETLELPEGLSEIGRGAFQWSDLKTLTLPESVDTLYQDTFAYTKNLETLTIEHDALVPIKDMQYLPDFDDNEWARAFDGTNEALTIYVPDALLEEYKAHPSWDHARDHLKPMSDMEE